ncbi:MAG: hypothetical protein A2Z20_02950 [Bdellovibrionales bacterium RBG_16_40_8]|nr:MAG: hypothetical protein A2Z20_02950 [Bdellovibrionales bacterium RBG_16_40_8]
MPIIIIINMAVFFMWKAAGKAGMPYMEQNFLVSWQALAEGRWWTPLTSVFSHNMFFHFLINMLVLSNFGNLLEMVLGRVKFLKFYIIAGLISSLTHAVVSTWLLDEPELPALGASGAIVGLVLIFCLMFPREKILIFGFIPLPALWGAVIFIGLDIWGLVAQAEGGGLPIGHGAHLGGAFTGIIYYYFFIRPHRDGATSFV